MKSASSIINLFKRSLSNSKPNRRHRSHDPGQVNLEILEPRLLLTASSLSERGGDEGFKSLIEDTEEPTIDSFLFEFDSAQDLQELLTSTGANAVEASEFVENGYRLYFDDEYTVSAAYDRFSDLPGFDSLFSNAPIELELTVLPTDPLVADQFQLVNTGQGGGAVGIDTNVESVFDQFTGAGVVVAVVDDGLQVDHPDLIANVNTQIDIDVFDGDDDPSPGTGQDGHGTSVAGIIASTANNGIGTAGVAFGAELVGVRLLGGGGLFNSQIADALTHAIDVVDIYNNSFGDVTGGISPLSPEIEGALEQAVTNGRGGLGAIHVFSAGNSALVNDNVNYSGLANSRHTLTVGALANTGVRASFSEVGASLVVVAPSNGGTLGVTTTDLTGADGFSAGDFTDTFGGTSAAAPAVSGVIALILEANPNLTSRDVTDILIRTGEQVDPTNPDWVQNGAGLWVNHEYGFGNIDAAAAVALAQNYVSLDDEISSTVASGNLGIQIADNGAAVSASVTVAGDDVVESLEYVEIVFNATHSFRGDLNIVLTSPSGTQSVLAEARLQDPGADYTNYVFTTNRNWAESNEGEWTLTVQDQQELDVGTLDSFELRFFGTDSVGSNNTPGFTVTESGGGTTVEELGATDTVQVFLNTQPTSNVVIDVTPSDETEVTVSQAQLLFTPDNFATPQTVTISGVADGIEDGDQQSTLTFAVNDAASDAAFGTVASFDVEVTTTNSTVTVPSQPVIVSPTAAPGISTPRFEWLAADNAFTYELVVRDFQTGNVVEEIRGLTSLSHTFATPLTAGIYQATVVAFSRQGVPGPASEPLTFAIGVVGLPGAPTILSPALAEVLATQTPIFEWTTVPDAVTYEIEVVVNGETRVATVAPVLGASTVQFQFPEAFSDGAGTVTVRALNVLGQAGPSSESRDFLIDVFEVPDRPVFIQPNFDVSGNAFPEFEWVAAGGVTYQLWVGQVPDDPANGTASTLNNRIINLRDHTETTYTHFSALQNGNYVAWVRAFNEAGEASAWSLPNSFSIDVPVPARPVITQVLENGTRPTILWDTTGDEFPANSTFHLWVNNLTTGEARVIEEQALTTTSFTPDFDLTPGRYRAWVRVTSPVGVTSLWSVPVDFSVVVGQPGNTTVLGPVPAEGQTAILTDLPTFTWTAAENATSYELWVNNTSQRITRIINEIGVEGTSFTAENSLPQGTYKAWVRGINAAGDVGEWSIPLTFEIDIPGPATPTVIGPAPNQIGTVTTATPTIIWETLGGAETYNLELQTSADQQLVVRETGLTEEQYTVGFQLDQTTYRVRVQAVNSAGETSEYSEWFTFRIDVANPTTPVALTPDTTITSNTVTFTFTQETGSVSHEILVRDLLRQETIVFQVSADASSFTGDIASFEAQLANGTYRFWVRGFNSQGVASGFSNFRSFIVDGDDLVSLDVQSDLPLTSLKNTAAEEVAAERPEVSAEELYLAATGTATPTLVEQVKLPGQAEAINGQADAVLEAVLAEFADPASSLVLNRELRTS